MGLEPLQRFFLNLDCMMGTKMPRTMEQIVGENIAKARTRLQITQRELGERIAKHLNAETWSVATVSAAEKGARGFSASDLTAFALALDVLPGALLLIPDDVDTVRIGSKIGGKSAGEGGRDHGRGDVQRLGSRLDPDSPMEFVTEIGRDVGTWRDQAGEIADALRSLAGTIAKHAERAQGLSDRADDIHDLAMTARVQMLRYVQGSTPSVEDTEN